ncbi:TetR/AcrR family transcriptional regulator [Ketobacter alkanivorans]|uniref:HTH tetR-type domain-containing protein n=1 Tax=Ketobacter alkanivorans TaxID=1917421 RepID=A0A2K9LG41_9GAMM|nr:TetR/AcrR family transcriptional regulator [Ketobacter alkanivorans]AUM11131.1 hypothetical protein Kalk_01200 [Ketobacter alkanivorans]
MTTEQIDLKMRKIPRQARSKASVDAIIQACRRILVKRGYEALTTNEIARVAGVSVGSLYEYFPGKEAVVAAMVRDMADRYFQTLKSEITAKHNNSYENAMRHWVGLLFNLVQENKRLVQVLVFDVPYSFKIIPFDTITTEFFNIVMKGAARSQNQYKLEVTPEILYLISTTTAGTLTGLVFAPSPYVDKERVLDQLANKIAAWMTQ